MFGNKRDAEARLASLLMDDLPVERCDAAPVALPGDWFRTFRRARTEFLESLSDSIRELVFLNLSQNDVMNLLTARSVPENLSVKFRRPILYGGPISPENMFLTPSFPYGFNLDIFLAEQSGSVGVWYPNPEKKVYVSANMISGGDGGNATSDRLAQAFAQMGRGMG
jgi:hypothetical protein